MAVGLGIISVLRTVCVCALLTAPNLTDNVDHSVSQMRVAEPMRVTTLPSVVTLVASLLTFALCAHAQAVPLDAVMKDCQQKTIVYGRAEDGKMVKVGERISGYCQGILEGMFAVLLRTGTICVRDKVASADFLLSAVLTYQTETKSKDNDAASVAEAAFKRAFNCSN